MAWVDDIALFLAIVLAAIVLGSMGFFSFVMAPLVFRQLDRERAAAFMRAAFPLYYKVLAGQSVAATVMAALIPAWTAVMLLAAVTAGFVLLRIMLLPAIERHRQGRATGNASADKAFKRLHGLSMLTNLAQLVAVGVALVFLAT